MKMSPISQRVNTLTATILFFYEKKIGGKLPFSIANTKWNEYGHRVGSVANRRFNTPNVPLSHTLEHTFAMDMERNMVQCAQATPPF